MEKIIKNLVLNLIVGILGTGALVGVIATIGYIVHLAEAYLIVRIVMVMLAIYSLYKFATE